MAVDDSSLLPTAPPPRPAGRTSAIEAALRRFDGVADPAARPERTPWAWGGRPQWSLAISASVVAIIGIPAALIAINDQGPPPSPKAEHVARPKAPTASKLQFEPAAEPEVAEAVPAPVTTARIEPNRYPVLPDAKAPAQEADRVAAPVAAMAPPPPAAPPPSTQSAMEADQSIAVTGSRIRQPSLVSDRAESEAIAQAAEKATGRTPRWVLEDPAYRSFLSELQNAIRNDRRSAVARLISYPLRVNGGGGTKVYREPSAVVRDYDEIFTAGVKAAILGQQFETLFGRDLGVMIGDGAVWFDHICRGRNCEQRGPVRITSINR